MPIAVSRSARRALAAGAALLLALAAASPAPAAKPAKPAKSTSPRGERITVASGREISGLACTIVAQGADSAYVGRTVDAALDRAARFVRTVDLGDTNAELSRLNASPAQTRIELSPDLYEALDVALALAAETDGAFDPTIEPLRRAWGESGDRAPAPEALNEARIRTGWRRVRLEAGTHTAWLQHEGMALELDDVARGVALERIEAALREAGITRALAGFGTSWVALSDHEGWSLKVAHPGDPARPAATLAVRTCAVATTLQSGAEVDPLARRYRGVLDPARGVPVDDSVSVTVVTRSAARASALSTALLVMGRERAGAYAESHPDLGVLWLEPDGGGVRAWKWNLPPVAAAGGTKIEWRN